MTSSKKDHFTYYFPIWVTFISFFVLFALAWPSIKVVSVDIHTLILGGGWGKSFSGSPLSMVLAVRYLSVHIISGWVSCLLLPVWWELLSWNGVGFFKCFVKMMIWVFFFSWIWFVSMVNYSLIFEKPVNLVFQTPSDNDVLILKYILDLTCWNIV